MFCPPSLASLLALGLLTERVIAAPIPTPVGQHNSELHYLVNLPDCLVEFLVRRTPLFASAVEANDMGGMGVSEVYYIV
jgi:hypothetical protein